MQSAKKSAQSSERVFEHPNRVPVGLQQQVAARLGSPRPYPTPRGFSCRQQLGRPGQESGRSNQYTKSAPWDRQELEVVHCSRATRRPERKRNKESETQVQLDRHQNPKRYGIVKDSKSCSNTFLSYSVYPAKTTLWRSNRQSKHQRGGRSAHMIRQSVRNCLFRPHIQGPLHVLGNFGSILQSTYDRQVMIRANLQTVTDGTELHEMFQYWTLEARMVA